MAEMSRSAVFDVMKIARSLPEAAETMLVDVRLTDEAEASCRVFRVYRAVPEHFHAGCDEYLLVVSGRARIVLGEAAAVEVGPGELIFFKRGTVHGIPELVEEPFVVLAVDTPRREPGDVRFVDPGAGTVEGFIRTEGMGGPVG